MGPSDVVEYRSICDISRDITGIALRKAEVTKEGSCTRAKEQGHVLLALCGERQREHPLEDSASQEWHLSACKTAVKGGNRWVITRAWQRVAQNVDCRWCKGRVKTASTLALAQGKAVCGSPLTHWHWAKQDWRLLCHALVQDGGRSRSSPMCWCRAEQMVSHRPCVCTGWSK